MSFIEPENCSCAALRQAARHVTRAYDEALSPIGLGLNQYAILLRLQRSGAKVMHELAELLVMDRSTLGHLLRPLEKRGLVRLDVAQEDRRRRLVSLTRKGATLVQKAAPLWEKAEGRFELVYGSAPARNLRRVLRQVAAVDF